MRIHEGSGAARRAAGPALIALALAAGLASPVLAKSAPSFAQAFAPFAAIPEVQPVASGAVDLTTLTPPSQPVAEELGSGIASWYGRTFAGHRTASGESFDPGGLTAAHRSLPFGSLVRVTNPGNGRSVVVRINDRGPFARGRLIDLSEAAARQLGIVGSGSAPVSLALLTS